MTLALVALVAGALLASGAPAETPRRLWIDSDAACGLGPFKDVDDCVAIAMVARDPEWRVLGVSSVFGNAGRAQVDGVLDALLLRWSKSESVPPRVSGARRAGDCADNDAARAIAAEAAREPLVVLALGPLTNLACAAALMSEDAGRFDRVVAVMGARPGEVFHPSRERRGGILFGHGPIVQDLNAELDPEAVRALLARAVRLELVPYEGARKVVFGPAEIASLKTGGSLGRHVGEAAEVWRKTWRTYVGVDGFYPFDALAALHLLRPDSLECRRDEARIARDRRVFLGISGPMRLVVERRTDARPVQWCAGVTARTGALLLQTVGGS